MFKIQSGNQFAIKGTTAFAKTSSIFMKRSHRLIITAALGAFSTKKLFALAAPAVLIICHPR